MPKIKTNRGAAKRFRKSAIRPHQAGQRIYQSYSDTKEHVRVSVIFAAVAWLLLLIRKILPVLIPYK